MAGTITALVAQKRNKERVNVYIDGQFALGLAMIEALKLRKGQRLSDAEVAHLRALDEIEVAHEAALKFLSYRPRSTDEVRRRLNGKFDEQSVARVIERLEQAGLLDDEAFARYWVENRQQFGPRSTKALRHELRQKSVPDAAIVAALAELDEDEAAYQAASRQARRYAHADQQTFRKRLGDFLVRRGFGYGTARNVVNRLWGERSAQGDDVPAHDTLDMDNGE